MLTYSLYIGGVREDQVRGIPYNRYWRSLFNLNSPPAKLVIPGVDDQEDVF
jgi:hypothetical protein